MSLRNNKKHNHYRKKTVNKSIFDGTPTLVVNEYLIPKPYVTAVHAVIGIFKSGTPFNKAVDQAATTFPNINRNKLAEHTLKYIANQY